jgi:hypothetical protein
MKKNKTRGFPDPPRDGGGISVLNRYHALVHANASVAGFIPVKIGDCGDHPVKNFLNSPITFRLRFAMQLHMGCEANLKRGCYNAVKFS